MTVQAPERPTGVRRYLPGLASIADGRAALTVWAVVVPQSLAYATLAGVPSVNGLYAAVGALALYALFGTCRDLNMGAEPTVALMAAAAVAPLVVDADDVIELTSLAALLVGGWCILGFVFQLGFISEFLSRPILAASPSRRRLVADPRLGRVRHAEVGSAGIGRRRPSWARRRRSTGSPRRRR